MEDTGGEDLVSVINSNDRIDLCAHIDPAFSAPQYLPSPTAEYAREKSHEASEQ